VPDLPVRGVRPPHEKERLRLTCDALNDNLLIADQLLTLTSQINPTVCASKAEIKVVVSICDVHQLSHWFILLRVFHAHNVLIQYQN